MDAIHHSTGLLHNETHSDGFVPDLRTLRRRYMSIPRRSTALEGLHPPGVTAHARIAVTTRDMALGWDAVPMDLVMRQRLVFLSSVVISEIARHRDENAWRAKLLRLEAQSIRHRRLKGSVEAAVVQIRSSAVKRQCTTSLAHCTGSQRFPAHFAHISANCTLTPGQHWAPNGP